MIMGAICAQWWTNLGIELEGCLGVLDTNHRVVKLKEKLRIVERWERE